MSNWIIRIAGLIFIIFLYATSNARAQDPVFSQYTTSPVYANPAMVGLFDGDTRLIANYRSQWSSVLVNTALQTYAASAEMRYNVGGRDFLGVGVNLLHDEGGVGDYAMTRAGLNLGLQKYLGGGRGRNNTVLGFGARIGYGQHRFDPDNLWFSSGIDTTSLSIETGPRSLPAGFTSATRGYLDVSGGLNLAVVRRSYSLNFGLAAHHLNQPNVSFLNNTETLLSPRYSALINTEFLFEDNLRLIPSAMYEMQGQVQRMTAGAGLYFRPNERSDAGFRMGLYGRTANQLEEGMYFQSLIFAGQLEFNRTTFGMSYDLNTGILGQTTDGRGAFEISLSWTRPSTSRYKVICPKF